MFNIRTILHPTDFSERSDWAFHLACSLARDHGAKVLVLHVATPAPFVAYTELERALQGPDGYRQELEGLLHLRRPPDASVPVEYRLVEGVSHDEILRVAAECGCDLIVLGTHGRTGLRRLVMGSVAEQIVRRATCPVLTVNTPSVPETAVHAVQPCSQAHLPQTREAEAPVSYGGS